MMEFYILVVVQTLFPLKQWVRKHATVAVRQPMEKPQWRDKVRLKKLQICGTETAHPVAENK